ncbi:MAG TPA: hypothetical protein EYP85_05965 [Armatimonadetes bacterium]|nr:hypothetical protein [Armatimonadota bacterium]
MDEQVTVQVSERVRRSAAHVAAQSQRRLADLDLGKDTIDKPKAGGNVMGKLTRREFLRTLGGAVAASVFTSRSGRSDEPPINLLFLMTDQHHHAVLGCAGNPLVKTPNLDQVAAEGVRFTHAFCVTPYCSPTRAAIVTGRYPHSIGVWRNIKGGDGKRTDPARFREPRRIYQHQLAARGYRCHQLGKWHLGDPAELTCFPEGQKDITRPRQLTNQRRREAGPAAYDPGPREGEVLIGNVYFTAAMAAVHNIWKDEKRRSPQDLSIIGRSRLKPEYHFESVLADYCIELLKRHRNEPFAITYSVSPPHAFWVAPARFYDLYDPDQFELPLSWLDRPAVWASSQPARMVKLLGEENVREYLRCYYAQVTMMDWCMGRILNALEDLGLADRTLVLFTSDHGDMQGAHGMMGKSVGAFYEEIVRVPLLIRLPGLIPAGRVTNAFASSIDLAPTILDLVGAEPLPDVHGRSLRPFLEGQPDDGRPIFGQRGNPRGGSCGRMIRTREWKLCLYGSGYRELYHLTEDPYEMHNLADDPAQAATFRQLAAQLREHLERTNDPALPSLFPSAGGGKKGGRGGSQGGWVRDAHP